MSETASRIEDLQRALACVKAHPRAPALAALACDVLGAQAEGRTLFSGQRFMAQRASAHGLDAESAKTELGNLLGMLERGPSDASEHALVAAFAARGVWDAWLAADASGQRAWLDKWVAALDWLETTTRYRVWQCLIGLADAASLGALCDAVAQAALRDDAVVSTIGPDEPLVRARLSLRIALLRLAPIDAARPALLRVRARASDASTRALSAIGLGDPLDAPSPAEMLRVFGAVASATHSAWLRALRVLTGYALVHALLRALGFVVRLRRELELELDGRSLRERRRTWLLGRVVRSRDAIYPLERVRGAARTARYALVRTLLGLASLSIGVLLGGHFLFDALRGGATGLLSAAALVIGLGAALDLALDVLGSARRGQVRVQIDVSGAPSLALAGAPLADADRFLDALAARLGPTAK
jgi:hypothetical protein